jgi:hypothetical protein
MTVAQLREHLDELPDSAVIKVQVNTPAVRALVFQITHSSDHDGREVVILNAR